MYLISLKFILKSSCYDYQW